MKKVIAIIISLIMVFSLSATAFASIGHNHTITIYNANEGYEYTAYQIFSGDLSSDGVLSNIEWGEGVDGAALLAELQTHAEYASCTDAAGVAVVLSAANSMDDPRAVAFAEIAAKHVVEANGVDSVRDGVTGHYIISPLEDGYYIVINETIPEGQPNTTVSRYILEVVRDIAVTHKGTFPTVEKKILENGNPVDTNEASVGEDVIFQITGTIPTTIDTYLTYYYAFTDTLSKGLTYNDDMVITVNGVDVTEYFYIEAGAYDAVNGTAIYAGIQDILALELLTSPSVGEITHATQVIITYSAELNENAVVAAEGNPNKVRLEYDNNPNEEGEPTLPPPNPDKPVPTEPIGITPEDEVRTYVTELTILKKDGAGNSLKGAEFTLSGEAVNTVIVTRETFYEVEAGTGDYWKLLDGTYTGTAPEFDDPATGDVDEDTSHAYASLTPDYKLGTVTELIEKTESVEVRAFVGEDGYVTFTGLGAGHYILTESVTPAGFNTIDPIEFTIEFNPATGLFSAGDNNWILVETDNTLYAEIINVAGNTLPSTGGIGTTLFYIAGGILFAGALIFLVTKKRMNE